MLTLLTALLIAQGHVHEAGDAATAYGTYNAAMAAQPHPLDPDAPKPKGSMTELKIGDQISRAYVARPKGKPQGALLVIHEYWGLNDWVKDKADQLAAEGYLAVAIDLYKGEGATDPQQAAEPMQAQE